MRVLLISGHIGGLNLILVAHLLSVTVKNHKSYNIKFRVYVHATMPAPCQAASA